MVNVDSINMPYINPNANLDLVQDVPEPSSVPICHVYWYKDAVPLCSRRKPQWVGQVDCHGGHLVRCSNCLGPMVLPMFLPWFYTLLHIVYHMFLMFYHVFQCFFRQLQMWKRDRLVASFSTAEVGPATTRRKSSRLSSPTRWAPENQLGK